MVIYEKRMLLSGYEYDYFRGFFPGKQDILLDTYYDTDTFQLHLRGVIYRIRKQKGLYYTSAIFQPRNWDSSLLKVPIHTSETMDDSLWRKEGLRIQGLLQITRSGESIGKDVSVFLDQNIYLGTMDHELIIQHTLDGFEEADRQSEKMASYLASFHQNQVSCQDLLTRVNHHLTKVERLFKRKRMLQSLDVMKNPFMNE